MSLHAELGCYFRADKPTPANDYDLHDEPFGVAFEWSLRFRAFYRWASTWLACFPPTLLGHIAISNLRFITNRFTGEFQVEAFAQFGDTVDIHLQFVPRTEFI